MAHNDMQIAASFIEEELRCPVCRTVPRSLPIPCCPGGHLVCQSCRGKIRDDNCPSCRLPMGNNVSTVAGALVDKIPHACRFSDLGCEERNILKHIVEHEKNCSVKESLDKESEDNLDTGHGETRAGLEVETLVDHRVNHRGDGAIGQQRTLSVKIGSAEMTVMRNGRVTTEMKCSNVEISGKADDVIKLVTKFIPNFGAIE